MGESSLFNPYFIYKTLEKVYIIRNFFKTTYSWKKSYADHRARELEFEEEDKVYQKKFHMKGVVRFGMKRKFSPRYIGPYEILQKIGKVAYELIFPSDLD